MSSNYERWHSDGSTSSCIERYYTNYAREPEYRRTKETHNRIMTNIQAQLQKSKKCLHLEFTGSSYEGVQIGPDIEFDVMVVISGTGLRCQDTAVAGYKQLSATDSFAWGSNEKQKLFRGQSNILEPEKVVDVYYGVMQKIVNESNFGYDVKLRRHGPAIQMDVSEGMRELYSVDIVPTFQINAELYVAKPFKDDTIPSDGNRGSAVSWRRSTSLQEKSKIDAMDRDNGRRKQVLRIMKAFIKRDPQFRSLTSYHVKTALMHLCDRERDWSPGKLVLRIIDMLKFLEQALNEGSLKHYFLHINLFQDLSGAALGNMYSRIKRIHAQEHIFKETFRC